MNKISLLFVCLFSSYFSLYSQDLKNTYWRISSIETPYPLGQFCNIVFKTDSTYEFKYSILNEQIKKCNFEEKKISFFDTNLVCDLKDITDSSFTIDCVDKKYSAIKLDKRDIDEFKHINNPLLNVDLPETNQNLLSKKDFIALIGGYINVEKFYISKYFSAKKFAPIEFTYLNKEYLQSAINLCDLTGRCGDIIIVRNSSIESELTQYIIGGKYDPIHTKKFHAVLCIDRSTKTEDVNFILKEFFKLSYITSVFVEIQKEQDEFNTGFLQLKNNCRINYKMYDEFNDWCINNFPIIGDKQEVINIKH